MKTFIAITSSHFLATLLGGATVALVLALTGCSAPVGEQPFAAPEAIGRVQTGALTPPQTLDSCSGFQGHWGLLALNCPAGTLPQTGECHSYGASVIASGTQGANAWGCQASNATGSGSFSICVTVVCQ